MSKLGKPLDNDDSAFIANCVVTAIPDVLKHFDSKKIKNALKNGALVAPGLSRLFKELIVPLGRIVGGMVCGPGLDAVDEVVDEPWRAKPKSLHFKWVKFPKKMDLSQIIVDLSLQDLRPLTLDDILRVAPGMKRVSARVGLGSATKINPGCYVVIRCKFWHWTYLRLAWWVGQWNPNDDFAAIAIETEE